MKLPAHPSSDQGDLFDLLTLAEPITAPLGFTVDAYTPDEHHTACERWRIEHGTFAMSGRSHMWHCAGYDVGCNRILAGDHPTVLMTAGTRCEHYGRPRCSCVGDLLYRIHCEGCGHVTGIHAHENDAVEDHLDHCWTGWRNLPVLTQAKNGTWKIPADYPTTWQIPGAPIRTLRQPLATRHVPSRASFGGYDTGTITP
ncbi:hypothetical protein FQ377_13865 [Arthrobacter echini]|uniref:Uncharacterized protein n=1 Tax=Arthrobacter echini TaxID=1529066 RepID=A0A5D0XKE6_9MICC|nr:DUF6349 family protein [Arthrobacter echini]TYC96606.1 hypothetical protein FQ377_13865 [Arthrobacter echini]